MYFRLFYSLPLQILLRISFVFLSLHSLMFSLPLFARIAQGAPRQLAQSTVMGQLSELFRFSFAVDCSFNLFTLLTDSLDAVVLSQRSV